MNKRGQSIIEYSLIAILVILGVVYMGPYVLRSINAHFKLWDVGVQDSFEENLNQANVSVVPDIPLTCNNCFTTIGPCGNGTAGQCGIGYHAWNHTCPPPSVQGCDGAQASGCTTTIDPSCCTTLSPQGCGTIPLNQKNTSTTNCSYGQQILGYACGNSPVVCQNDVQDCPLPTCVGTPDPGSTPCPQAIENLDAKTNYSDVANKGACSPTGQPACQNYCSAACPLVNGVCTCGSSATYTVCYFQFWACQTCAPYCAEEPGCETRCAEPGAVCGQASDGGSSVGITQATCSKSIVYGQQCPNGVQKILSQTTLKDGSKPCRGVPGKPGTTSSTTACSGSCDTGIPGISCYTEKDQCN